MHPMFEFAVNTPWTAAGLPQFGGQDRGLTPGGALDLFAHQTGQILLGNDTSSPSVEFIFPLQCNIRCSGWVALTGAPRKNARRSLSGGSIERIPHGQVIRVEAGETLEFDETVYGFRSYLNWRSEGGRPPDVNPEHRQRGAFSRAFSWPDPEGCFRCVAGPEWGRLRNPELVEQEGWQVSRELSRQGLRLEHTSGTLQMRDSSMISSVVADGTVQLTASGPYVLLRHRQTLGGYPRILNVISADVDLLAQLAPGQPVRFRMVEIEEGREAARLKHRELEAFKRCLSG